MRYDLHIHTHYSKCSILKPAVALDRAKKLGLDGIAITDHNSIKGALAASKLNKDRNFEVIKSEEITTDRGHVLALYVHEEIKPGNLFDVLDKIKKQDGLAIIAHPFAIASMRSRLKISLKKIKDEIDGIEILNSRCFFPWENKKAAIMAKRAGIAGTAGSDAHFVFEIGRAVTIFDGDLRKAIKGRKIQVDGSIKFASVGRFLSLVHMIRKRGGVI